MKEITRIHLAKISYEIETDAKDELNNYFTQLKTYTNDESIFGDIEIRVTELLADFGVGKDGIITLKEVEKVKAQLGDPKIFADDNADDNLEDSSEPKLAQKKLYRDTQNGMLGGVVAGLSLYFGLDMSILRIVLAIFMLFPPTAAFLWPLYIIMCVVVPPARTANDILRLKGEKIAASSLKQANEEYDFEAISRRKRTVKRGLTIVAGALFIVAAVGGAIVTTVVLLGFLKDNYSRNHYNQLIAPFSMMVAAGLMFVVFCMISAYTFFVQRIKMWQVVSLIFLTVVGVSSFFAGLTIFVPQIREINKLSVSQIEVSKDNLKNVKTLIAEDETKVVYVVSDQLKAEVRGIRRQPDLKPNFRIDGDSLVVESSEGEVVIYGPELNYISADSATVEYRNEKYQAHKKFAQANLLVRQSDKSNVFITGRGSIEKLNLDINDSDFYAKEVSVDNLVLSTFDEGIVRLKKINKAEIRADDRCGDYREQSFLELGVLGGEIKLNGNNYNLPTSCFKIVKEVKYDRN